MVCRKQFSAGVTQHQCPQQVQAHVIPSVTRLAQDTFQHSFCMYRELTGPVIIVIVKIRAKAYAPICERGVESLQDG